MISISDGYSSCRDDDDMTFFCCEVWNVCIVLSECDFKRAQDVDLSKNICALTAPRIFLGSC